LINHTNNLYIYISNFFMVFIILHFGVGTDFILRIDKANINKLKSSSLIAT